MDNAYTRLITYSSLYSLASFSATCNCHYMILEQQRVLQYTVRPEEARE